MKLILPILFLVTFCSCYQKYNQPQTRRNSGQTTQINNADTLETNKKPGNTTADSSTSDWELHQDSLRNEILKHKENKIVKESFLQEMYIRNVVTVANDSIFVTIPFNLHSPDCGAPDCYSTDVSFSIKLQGAFLFPKSLKFREHEHGCVLKETNISGTFHLLENTARQVIYHSAKYQRTLVLYSSYKDYGTTAYYFTGVSKGTVNGKNLNQVVRDYNEDDTDAFYPFMSVALTTNEYENFVTEATGGD